MYMKPPPWLMPFLFMCSACALSCCSAEGAHDAKKTADTAKPASDLVAIYRRIILGDGMSWVLFRNGTCFIVMEPGSDLRQQAIDSMREWGPVEAGTPQGDFGVTALTDYPGFVVTGWHPDMLVYVSPEDAGSNADDLTIGLLGRARRDQDAHELQVIHVEDNRARRD